MLKHNSSHQCLKNVSKNIMWKFEINLIKVYPVLRNPDHLLKSNVSRKTHLKLNTMLMFFTFQRVLRCRLLSHSFLARHSMHILCDISICRRSQTQMIVLYCTYEPHQWFCTFIKYSSCDTSYFDNFRTTLNNFLGLILFLIYLFL